MDNKSKIKRTLSKILVRGFAILLVIIFLIAFKMVFAQVSLGDEKTTIDKQTFSDTPLLQSASLDYTLSKYSDKAVFETQNSQVVINSTSGLALDFNIDKYENGVLPSLSFVWDSGMEKNWRTVVVFPITVRFNKDISKEYQEYIIPLSDGAYNYVSEFFYNTTENGTKIVVRQVEPVLIDKSTIQYLLYVDFSKANIKEGQTITIYDPIEANTFLRGSSYSYFFNVNNASVFDNSTNNAQFTWTQPYYYNASNAAEGAYSIQFNGTNYIARGGNSLRTNVSNFIWSGFLYSNYSNSKSGDQMNVFSAGSNPLLLMIVDTGKLRFGLDWGGSGTCDLDWFETGLQVPFKTWVHVVAWANGTHCGVFLNSSTTKTYNETQSGRAKILATDNFYLGKADSAGGMNYEGQMDCVNEYWGNDTSPVNATVINYYINLTCTNQTSSGSSPSPDYNASLFSYNLSMDGSTICSGFTNVSQSGSNDLIISQIKYTIPYNFSIVNHTIAPSATMPINFTITNTYTNYAQYINCSWTASKGFHYGNITIDAFNNVSETIENNNYREVWIPYVNRPFMLYNLSEWQNDIQPIYQNTSSGVPYNRFTQTQDGSCDDFTNSWGGSNLYSGKEARECATVCIVKNWSSTSCQYAINNIKGWANRTITTYNDVQSNHDLADVGIAIDMMFPNITAADYNLISKNLTDICLWISNNSAGADLTTDNPDVILGDNGKGFYSGAGMLCLGVLGLSTDNPTLILNNNISSAPQAIRRYWDRTNNYLRSYKNDSWAKYQEGTYYKFYSQYHTVDFMYISQRMGYADYSLYQNAQTAMAREFIWELLDMTYAGNTIRNAYSTNLRWNSRGDSLSYEDPSARNTLGTAIIIRAAMLSNDNSTKLAAIALENLINSKGYDTMYPTASMDYLYPQLLKQVNWQNASNVSSYMPAFIYDNANDVMTIRTNYSFANDTILEVDGGEERGGGHAQAQGGMLYALGEPFIDYQQTPNNDDTRGENFKWGVSYVNDSGQLPSKNLYNDVLGTAKYNQYYGGANTVYFSTNYPDYRTMPISYTGDVEDYLGTADANLAGVDKWMPVVNGSQRQKYIKFGDMVAVYTETTTTNPEVYLNFINYYSEFTTTRQGYNLSMQRKGTLKNMSVDLIYTNQSTLDTLYFNTTRNVSYSKTGDQEKSQQYGRGYTHYSNGNTKTVQAYAWAEGNLLTHPTKYGVNDTGAQQGNNVIIFDMTGDNLVNNTYLNCVGWGGAYNLNNDEFACFNTTEINNGTTRLFNSSLPVSVDLKRSGNLTTLSINSMARSVGIDYPQSVRVSLGVNNGTVTDINGNSVSSSVYSDRTDFTYSGGSQNGNTYYITSQSATSGGSSPSTPTGNYTCDYSETPTLMYDDFILAINSTKWGQYTYTSGGGITAAAITTSTYSGLPILNVSTRVWHGNPGTAIANASTSNKYINLSSYSMVTVNISLALSYCDLDVTSYAKRIMAFSNYTVESIYNTSTFTNSYSDRAYTFTNLGSNQWSGSFTQSGTSYSLGNFVINPTLNMSFYAESHTTFDTRECLSYYYINNISYMDAHEQRVYVYNAYDNSSLSNFSVVARNDNMNLTCYANATNGYATFANFTNTTIFNITIPGFYESNVVVSQVIPTTSVITTLSGYAIQSLFNVSASSLLSNAALTTFSASIPNSVNSTTTGSLFLVTNDSQKTITGYNNSLISVYNVSTASTGTIKQVGLRFYDLVLKVNLINAYNGLPITNFNLTVNNSPYNYREKKQNITGSQLEYLLLRNQSYLLTVDPVGYQNTTVNLTINDTFYYNYTFYLYETNSITMNFRDEQTKGIIYNASAELISSVFSQNYSSNNTGSIFANLLIPAEYNVRYQSNGYARRSYYLLVESQHTYNITLYLLQNASAIDVTATVYDQDNNRVNDVTIKAYRYYLATNSYILVEMAKTSVDGTAKLHLEQNNEYYEFVLEYGGQQVLATAPAYIESSLLNFQIALKIPIGQTIYVQNKIVNNLTYNNATRSFRYYYNDLANAVSQGCMYVYKDDSLYNSSCATASSGILLVEIENITGSNYRADSFVYYSNVSYYQGSKYASFVENIVTELGKSGIFYVIILTILMAMTGIWSPVVMMLLLPIPSILFQILGFVDLGWENVIGLSVICLIIVYLISRKS